MNLKDFLALKDKPPELYWSCVIEPGWVQAGIWHIVGGATEVVGVGPGAAWETSDELLGAVDAALSSAIQKLPEDSHEPDKTVFGVPPSWVKGGEITEDHLAEIKKICTELSLNPVGFVVLSEAIAHLYKSEEGAPLSGIILGLGKENLEVSVFKLGNLAGTTSVARSVSLVEDVTEGLSRFEGASPLPSRFIIYDGKEGQLDEAKEAIMGADWGEGEKVKFLHTPKAEILTSERKVIAVSLAGAREIGNVTAVAPEKKESPPVQDEHLENVAPVENVSPKDLGFSVGEDVSLHKAPAFAVSPAPRQRFNLHLGTYFNRIKSLASRFNLSRTPLLNFIIFLLILVMAGSVYWWFFSKARVRAFVTPRSFQEGVNVTFDSGGGGDAGAGVIPAEAQDVEVSGDKTKATSGTKLIGDKAKGSVQIANGNGSGINLSAGTPVTSSSGLKYLTASEASISGQILPGSPGTATLDVTAVDIGAQYNLAKGEIFSVGNYSKALVAATSTGDFSGGSSRQISAVGKEDQTSLEESLKNELKQNAVDQLSGKATDNQLFVGDLAALDIKSENFDHKIGDEADSLKLSLTLNATGVFADRAKMLEYAKKTLEDKVPAGYVLNDDQINFTFTFIDGAAGKYNYKAAIEANFLPKINYDEMKGRIAGRTTDVVSSYLNSIPGFSGAEVILSPNLPGPFAILPWIKGHIELELVAEK